MARPLRRRFSLSNALRSTARQRLIIAPPALAVLGTPQAGNQRGRTSATEGGPTSLSRQGRRERTPAEWWRMYEAAMAEKRQAQALMEAAA